MDAVQESSQTVHKLAGYQDRITTRPKDLKARDTSVAAIQKSKTFSQNFEETEIPRHTSSDVDLFCSETATDGHPENEASSLDRMASEDEPELQALRDGPLVNQTRPSIAREHLERLETECGIYDAETVSLAETDKILKATESLHFSQQLVAKRGILQMSKSENLEADKLVVRRWEKRSFPRGGWTN